MDDRDMFFTNIVGGQKCPDKLSSKLADMCPAATSVETRTSPPSLMSAN